VRSDAEALSKIMQVNQSVEFDAAHTALLEGIDAWLNRVVEEGNEHFVDAGHSPGRLDFSLFEVLNLVDRSDTPLTQGVLSRVADVRRRYSAELNEYRGILGNELAAFNSITSEQSAPVIQPRGL